MLVIHLPCGREVGRSIVNWELLHQKFGWLPFSLQEEVARVYVDHTESLNDDRHSHLELTLLLPLPSAGGLGKLDCTIRCQTMFLSAASEAESAPWLGRRIQLQFANGIRCTVLPLASQQKVAIPNMGQLPCPYSLISTCLHTY